MLGLDLRWLDNVGWPGAVVGVAIVAALVVVRVYRTKAHAEVEKHRLDRQSDDWRVLVERSNADPGAIEASGHSRWLAKESWQDGLKKILPWK